MRLSAIVDLLSALATAMQSAGSRWYLFGAQAVDIWGQPRLSADVDVAVELGLRKPESFVSIMTDAGFDLRVRDVDDFVKKTRVLPFVHRASQIPLDVVLAGPGPEEEFLDRARPVDIGGVSVPVISPEDLLVTKVLAGRPKDLEDIRGILRQRMDQLDLARVSSLLDILERALGRSDLKLLFEAQLSAVRR